MAKTRQISFADHVGNALVTTLLHTGVKIGTVSLLTVRGRKSGQSHTVPVNLVEQGDQRWLVAPYGTVQWVRNIRAAGTATLTRGRHSEAISVTELPAQEAAPILKQYLLQVRVVRPYFDVTKDASPEAFESEAPRHPVFKITAVREPSSKNTV
ncbi:nitroreductase family deazaflavin-dependent oxidoreductase [Ktedonobacteria bacterium brp13]|nr:nitroreductase family deazaflavin-dependent oxidoreductase [Ktedonobacteria bacterium brp13]